MYNAKSLLSNAFLCFPVLSGAFRCFPVFSGDLELNELRLSRRMSIRTRLTFFIQKANASFSVCQNAMLGRVVLRRPLLGASCSEQQHQAQVRQLQHLPQRAEFSTLRRRPTGPMSARAWLPMRGLEEFRDPHPVKVNNSNIAHF